MLDVVAKWGPWLLAALALLPIAGAWRLWRCRYSLSRRAFVWRLIKNVSGLLTIGIGLWLLQIQLAPLTRSLVRLQAETGERVPEISFKRVWDDTPHHLREFEGKVVFLNLWAT